MNRRQRKKRYSTRAWLRKVRKAQRCARDWHRRWELEGKGPYPLPFTVPMRIGDTALTVMVEPVVTVDR